MADVIYALCALTSLACAALLLRGYLATRTRLLLWASLCFVGLATNNVLLFVDMSLVPEIDLSTWRSMPTLAGLGVLVFGLVWDS